MELHIDQYKYTNFLVDDVDDAQSHVDIMKSLMKGSAEQHATVADSYIASLVTGAKTSIAKTIATPEDAKEAVDEAFVALWNEGVKTGKDTYIVVSPWFYSLFKSSLTEILTNNVEMVERGIFGMYNGAFVKMSNNIYKDGDADCIAVMTKDAIAYADGIEEVEAYLKKYYGVTNIIWIEGLKNEDITDGHIDACVKFAEGNKLVTLPYDDFMWYCSETEKDWKTVTSTVNAEGVPYEIVEIPLTETFYEELEDYGCYLNYYVGNEVVLVPIYGDVNDQLAMDIIAGLYPTRKVVGINCLNLALFGGMVHCVTQQQPALDAIASAD